MSFYDDYVAEGLCCECCGGVIDTDEPGFKRRCASCDEIDRRQMLSRAREKMTRRKRAAS